jgi:hypothetical protein
MFYLPLAASKCSSTESVTFETLCWNIKHVLSNLGSLTGVYSRFSSCQRRVVVTFGCAYLIRGRIPEIVIVLQNHPRHPHTKGHFTLRPSANWTKDSSNLIGGEQKFIC